MVTGCDNQNIATAVAGQLACGSKAFQICYHKNKVPIG